MNHVTKAGSIRDIIRTDSMKSRFVETNTGLDFEKEVSYAIQQTLKGRRPAKRLNELDAVREAVTRLV